MKSRRSLLNRKLRRRITLSTATQDSAQTGTMMMAEAGGVPAMTLNGPYIFFAKLAIAGQGHHPPVGSYPTPPRIAFGNVRMSAAIPFGPWGGLKRVRGLVDEAAATFPQFGYPVVFKKLNDEVKGTDLKASATNIFNQANIGLYVGHSVAAIDIERNYLYPMSYVPIYNTVANTMEFVRSHDMRFGSTELKWMCFFSCNMFRDGLYRANGIYGGMKANFNVPMNGRLHILQGYATEMSVHPDFVFYWTSALPPAAFRYQRKLFSDCRLELCLPPHSAARHHVRPSKCGAFYHLAGMPGRLHSGLWGKHSTEPFAKRSDGTGGLIGD